MSQKPNLDSGRRFSEDVIDLVDVIGFFVSWWKLIFIAGVAGAVAATILLWLLPQPPQPPQQFKSKVLLSVSRVPMLVGSGASVIGHFPQLGVESAEQLRVRMTIPTTYPTDVVTSCQYPNQVDLLKAISDIHTHSGDIFGFSVRHLSPELSRQCAESLFQMVELQQADLVKSFTERMIIPSFFVIPGEPTRLLAPIYTEPEPKLPQNKLSSVAAWFVGGLFAGVLAALFWTVVTWYRRSASSNSRADN